jgi:hypothetical protein
MMMVIYENIESSIISDNSGLLLSYQKAGSGNNLKRVQRLLLGHQASGKHTLLSSQRDWISDGFCAGHCTRDFKLGSDSMSEVSIIGLEIHTRSLGTIAHIDVQYQNGTRYYLIINGPALSPTNYIPVSFM